MNARLIIAAVTVLLIAGFTQAAHLMVRDGGGLWGQVDRYIYDSDTEILSSPMSDGGSTYAEASINAGTEYSNAQSSMSAEVTTASYWGAGIGTAVILNANADCYSEDSSAEVWSYGNAGTLVPTYTDGIFFVVEPDGGENTGDPVQFQWRWSVQCYDFNGNVQASVGSGTMHLTRNVMPPTGLPETGILWSRSEVTFAEVGSDEETGSFVAQIGDVIGVFFNAGARADILGDGSSSVAVSTSMEIRASQTLPKLIEYAYAPGLVYDPDQNITFLKNWSAAGGPIVWDDANQWAHDFTFSSGGITYSDWRLPTTTDEQGAAVGEFGYLSTHYGISEQYLGPFANISAGDYWTAPQFSRDPNPNIAYAYTFSTTYGPAQWWSQLDWPAYVIPVFDGPPANWCPADFDNNGIVDFSDFAVFASYWLNERP